MSKIKEKQCSACGQLFYSGVNYQRFCCEECRITLTPPVYVKSVIIKRCVVCKVEFTTSRSKDKYCSKNCYDKSVVIQRASQRKDSPPAYIIMRFTVLERDGFKCQYCGRGVPEGVILEVDHVVPRALGGKDEVGNFVTACRDCNCGKSDRLLELRELRKELRT